MFKNEKRYLVFLLIHVATLAKEEGCFDERARSPYR